MTHSVALTRYTLTRVCFMVFNSLYTQYATIPWLDRQVLRRDSYREYLERRSSNNKRSNVQGTGYRQKEAITRIMFS